MRCLLLWIALALIGAAPAAAQFDPAFDKATAEAAFPAATAGHNRNLTDLFGLRGMPAPRMRMLSVPQVAAFLERKDEAAPYPANTSVLFFNLADGQLAMWLIDRSGLRAAARGPLDRGELDEMIRNLRLSLNVDGVATSRSPRFVNAPDERLIARNFLDRDLGQLSATLLPKPIVAGLKDTRHLLVVANGAIGAVPWPMLKLDRKSAVIDRMSVSVSPGLYDLDQMIRPWNATAAFANPLIVGDPLVPATPNWEVPPLDGAAAEAKRFASAIGKPALIGADARKDAILQRIDGASMLYFAAHGVSNPLDPLRGGFLMLSGDNADSAFLRAGEVQVRKMTAQLAVLSACQSGLGLIHDGGVIGLTRSFQKAGVPRVVMSLWSVDDDATTALMSRFQDRLGKQPPAMALRQAMLDTRKLYPEPRYWAAFILFGTPR